MPKLSAVCHPIALTLAAMLVGTSSMAQAQVATGLPGQVFTPTFGLTVNNGTSAAAPSSASAANPASTSMTARLEANDKKMQADSAASGKAPGNAYAQGLGQPNAAEAKEALARYQELQSARQRGIQVPVPQPANPVAADPALQGWLANWTDRLTADGVDPVKIRFEASRLNQDEFARWGSRLVRADEPTTAAESTTETLP